MFFGWLGAEAWCRAEHVNFGWKRRIFLLTYTAFCSVVAERLWLLVFPPWWTRLH